MRLLKYAIFFSLLSIGATVRGEAARSADVVLEGRLTDLVQRVDPAAVVLVRSSEAVDDNSAAQVDVKILSSLPNFPGQVLNLVRQMSSSGMAMVSVQVKPLPSSLMPVPQPVADNGLLAWMIGALASPAANTILMFFALAVGAVSAWLFMIVAVIGARRVQITFLEGVTHLSEAIRDSQPISLPIEQQEPEPVSKPAVLRPSTQPKLLVSPPVARKIDDLDAEFSAKNFITQENLIREALKLQS